MAPTPAAPIAAATRMGAVELTVADLGRSAAFYGETLGLEVRERAAGRARMGTAERDLLVLVEEAGAAPGARRRHRPVPLRPAGARAA